jgi:crotonobetainyl-CoA:carnitine CoA-transferase CaiB-like acyl-CoA transferase
VVTGICAALAVAAAVVRQRDDGVGDLIDVSLFDSDLALMAPRIAAYLAGDPEPKPSGGTDSVLAIYQSFPTADRDVVVAIGNDSMWVRFCEALEIPDLASTPGTESNEGRRNQRARLVSAISAKMATRPAAEWQAVLRNVGIPCSSIQTLSEVTRDPQAIARGSLLPVPGSDDALHSVRSPFRFGSVTCPRNERFPELGADTREILFECGFSGDDIDSLIGSGVVQSHG